ncbi:hypothetical protein HDU77_009682 [Chytriomyces hyalinus]|nr:hypothetical protein HDU77_009682 [Chytriomyces hyalinus]
MLNEEDFGVHGGLQCHSCGAKFQIVSIPPSIGQRHFESRNHKEKTEAAAKELNDFQDARELVQDAVTHNQDAVGQYYDAVAHNQDAVAHNQDADAVAHNQDALAHNQDAVNQYQDAVNQYQDALNTEGWDAESWDVDSHMEAAVIVLNDKQDGTDLVIDDTHNNEASIDAAHTDISDAGDTDAADRATTDVAAIGDVDASNTDDSDFSMSSDDFSEEDPSDIEESDLEVDPVPEVQEIHFPFKSKLEFSLLLLFSGLGASKFSGVPTLGRLRSLSANIRALLNISPKLYHIGDKRVYYIPIQQTIHLAFANPCIWIQLHTLPTLQNISSELYYSTKWFEEIPTPMVRVHCGNGFYDIFAGEAYYYDEDGVACIVPETFAAIKDGSVFACGKMATLRAIFILVN